MAMVKARSLCGGRIKICLSSCRAAFRLKERVEFCQKAGFTRSRANDLIVNLAVFHKEKHWDGTDAIPHRELLVLVDIHLADLGTTRALAGDLVDDWRDQAARPAPRRPEIEHDGNRRLKDFFVEIP